jgi:hypothetical protein
VDLTLLVDGGIDSYTAPLVIEARADILVAVTYLFRHLKGLNRGIHELMAEPRTGAISDVHYFERGGFELWTWGISDMDYFEKGVAFGILDEEEKFKKHQRKVTKEKRDTEKLAKCDCKFNSSTCVRCCDVLLN